MTVRDQQVITRGHSREKAKKATDLALRRAFDSLLAATAAPATATATAATGEAGARPDEEEMDELEPLSNTRWFLLDRNDNFDLLDDQVRTSC